MANRFCVSLTHAKDNQDKSTVAFVVANAAVGSGKETLVFLSVEGVRLAQKGYADDVREEGFAPLRELMELRSSAARSSSSSCRRGVPASATDETRWSPLTVTRSRPTPASTAAIWTAATGSCS